MSFYGDSLLSSPDPLGMPNAFSTPSPTKVGQSIMSPTKAKTEDSHDKHVQDIYISTPLTKRNVSPTKSPRATSPWRIRLTVETERVGDEQVIRSAKKPSTRRPTEYTTTITVPLKGGDDTPPAATKRGRGRPRKSLDNAVKRGGTPKPETASRRKVVSGILQEEDNTVNIWAPTPPKKTRGRPRKSTDDNAGTPQFEKAETPVRMPIADVVEENVISGRTLRTRSRQRRKEITPMKRPMKRAMDSDSDAVGSSAKSQDINRLDTRLTSIHGRKVGRMKPTATHVLTPRMPKGYVPQSSPESSQIQQKDEAMWRSMVRDQSGSPDLAVEERQDQADLDPTNEHAEFDTILESEGFSMISQSSLASTGIRVFNMTEQSEDIVTPDDTFAKEPSPSSSLSRQKEFLLESEQDARLQGSDHTTATASSPSMPPTTKETPHILPRPLGQGTAGTRELIGVGRTGIATHDVLDTQTRTQSLSSPLRQVGRPDAQAVASSPVSKAVSSNERRGNLFSGFGAGTRRELRAGLRLGEELGKRQQQSPHGNSFISPTVGSASFQNDEAKYPQLPSSNEVADATPEIARLSNEVQYPSLNNDQLPSPEGTVVETDDDQMSWKADPPVKADNTLSETFDPTPTQGKEDSLTSAPKVKPAVTRSDKDVTDREAEWQRERDAVSRQIEMANESQVIVVDSDNEEEEDEQGHDEMVEDDITQNEDLEETDIWQAEASLDRSEESKFEASEILLQPEAVKPRRSKLPSPWRRNSQIIYSDEFEPTEASTDANLFWQPAQVNSSRLRDEASSQSQMKVGNSTGSLLDRQLNPSAELSVMAMSPPKVPASRMANLSGTTRTTLEVKQCVKRKRITKLPATPDQTHSEDSSELAENVTVTPLVEKTVNAVFNSQLDPLLFKKPMNRPVIPKATVKVSDPPTIPGANRPISISSSSWLSRLTAPVISLFALGTPLPPPATKSDILCSGPYEPLCQLTPWNDCHARALAPLYYASLLYGSHIFPYNPKSRSAPYLGLTVATQPLGWTRMITKMDCGVTDAFMVLLDERGYALGEPGEEWIDESLVVRMCVTIWESMVMKGEVEVNGWYGEKAGWRLQRDKMWTKQDINWNLNESAYFERKRKEFRGLPSWIEMGIDWDPETKTARYPEFKV